jgi:hypothetical protein
MEEQYKEEEVKFRFKALENIVIISAQQKIFDKMV